MSTGMCQGPAMKQVGFRSVLIVSAVHAIWAGLAWAQVTASQPASQPGAIIGVYESEANAAEYKGVYQSPLRKYLKEKGLAFQVIGDKQASDSVALSRFAAV